MKVFVRLNQQGDGRLFDALLVKGNFALVGFDNGIRQDVYVVHRGTGASIVACDSMWQAQACIREYEAMAIWDFDDERQAHFTKEQTAIAKQIKAKYSILPETCAACGLPAEIPHHHAFDPADAGEASTKEESP